MKNQFAYRAAVDKACPNGCDLREFVVGDLAKDLPRNHHFIYALRQPGSKVIRYIGRTLAPVKRHFDHITRTKNDSLRQWIDGLLLMGVIPEMVVFFSTTDNGYSVSFIEQGYMRMNGQKAIRLAYTHEGKQICEVVSFDLLNARQW